MPESHPKSTQPQPPMRSDHYPILSSKTEAERSRLVAQAHARFSVIWGARWTSTFTTEELARLAQAEWGRALGTFTVSEINQAIDDYINSGHGFPPTLPEFVRACRSKVRREPQPAIGQDHTITPGMGAKFLDEIMDRIADGALGKWRGR